MQVFDQNHFKEGFKVHKGTYTLDDTNILSNGFLRYENYILDEKNTLETSNVKPYDRIVTYFDVNLYLQAAKAIWNKGTVRQT